MSFSLGDTLRNVGRTPKTRDLILREGIDLLSASGFAGVTFGVLAERTGLSKSGLFAHFKTKEAIELALLDASLKIATIQVIDPALGESSGLQQLAKFVSGWLGWGVRAGFAAGCPMTRAMFELSEASGPVKARLLEIEKHFLDIVQRMAEDAVRNGELKKDLDAAAFTWEIFGIYLSHFIAQRFFTDRNADRRALSAFGALIARSRPEETIGKRSRRRRAEASAL